MNEFLKVDPDEPVAVRFLTDEPIVGRITEFYGEPDMEKYPYGRVECTTDGTWGSCEVCDYFEFIDLLEWMTGIPSDRWT